MERIKYNFQKALAKGGFALFFSLIATFLLCFLVIVLFRFVLVAILPSSEDVFHDFSLHMWVTFLAMTDPGNMNQDNVSHLPFKVTAIMAGFLGVIIFSTLIAFITTILENNFERLRKGRNKFLEVNHTLILGWNEKVTDILTELIYANLSHPYASVVILSVENKEIIEDWVVKTLPNTQTTRIYITTGDCASLNELKRVNAAKAKSVIIIANCFDSDSEELKELSDIHAMKTILALNACQGEDSKIPIVVEFFHTAKTELIHYFNIKRIVYVHNWSIMGKLLLQTSLTSGLVRVYDEIFSFRANEIYILPYRGKAINFYELAYYYDEGIPLGIKDANGKITLKPDLDAVITIGQFLIILTKDDSTIKERKTKLPIESSIPFCNTPQFSTSKNILILGWHEIAYFFIKESQHRLPAGSSFTVVYKESLPLITKALKELQVLMPHIKIDFLQKDAFVFEEMEQLNPFEYDNIIILSQNLLEASPEKNDTISLMLLMMLLQIKKKQGIKQLNTSIIAQVLESDNQDLIVQTEIDDFITSNKLTTKILAQLSENPNLKSLYEELFNDEGSEIYVKPLKLYTQESQITNVSFLTFMEIANQRNEICLGICQLKYLHDPSKNFGFELNPLKTKKFTLTKDDFLIVLADNEL